MDYKSFINGVVMQSGQSRETIETLSDALLETIGDCLCNLDSIAVPAFGIFRPVKHDEYIAPDPNNGEMTCYPPSIDMQFHPSAMLKKRFKNG